MCGGGGGGGGGALFGIRRLPWMKIFKQLQFWNFYKILVHSAYIEYIVIDIIVRVYFKAEHRLLPHDELRAKHDIAVVSCPSICL